MLRSTLISTLLYSSSLLAAELICANPERYIIQDHSQKSTYENCKRHGMTWSYTKEGKLKAQVNFSDGKENGLYTSYHNNGAQKVVVNYLNGQKNGIQKTYYDTKQLASQVNYKKGKREGLESEWDIKGFKSAEVFYKYNYKIGLKKYFNAHGEVVRSETYKITRNPLVDKKLKENRQELLQDLSKYGLVPTDTACQEKDR